MPNIWTHFLFGRRLAETIGLREASAVPQLQRLFQFGCQGPDFLFYHRFWPWQTDGRMDALGTAMHTSECGPFLLDLLEYVQGKPLHAPETVYVLGFATHHILDRKAHPFVFYLSGFRKWDHQRFEIAVDTLVARKLLGIDTWRTPVWKELYVGESLPDGIPELFDRLARRHYPDTAERFSPDDWNDAYRDMIRAQKLFHDPSGLKRALTFGQIEPFVFKKRLAPLDFLNEAKKEWRHPSIIEERHSESFWELWDNAMADGERVMRAALHYIAGNDTTRFPDAPAVEEARRELEACLGDISYETGKPCADGHTIRHADPIL